MRESTPFHIHLEMEMKNFMAALFLSMMLSFGPAFATPESEVKATFDRFVVAQNAHDLTTVRELLLDSPNFLWISWGVPIWGRDAAMNRFKAMYQGTWKLSPDSSRLKVVMLTDTTAQIFVPIKFNIGPPGQPATDTLSLMNQTWVKSAAGWRIASILPIPQPSPPAAPIK
jgi:hypothetical protein